MKIRLPRVGRPIAETLAASLALQAVVIVSGVLAARMLGPLDRGNLALYWTIALVATQLAMLGLPLAVTFAMARRRWSLGQVWRALRNRILVSSVVAVATQAALVYFIFDGDSTVLNAAVLSVAVIPAILVQSFGVAALQGDQRFTAMNIARLLPFAGYSLALTVGFALGAESLMFVTSTWVGTYLVGSLLTLLIAMRPRTLGTAHPDGEPDAKEMTRFGIKGLLGAMSPTETFRADQLLVGLALSPTALGLYIAALAFTNLPRFLALSVGLVAYPRIAEMNDRSLMRRSIWKYTGIGIVIALIVVIPCIMLAEPMLGLFFGGAFESAAPTLQILLAGSVFLAGRRVLSDGLRGADHPETGTIAEVAAWTWLLPALFLGATFWDIEGVAIALSSSYVVSWIVMVILADRLGLGFRDRGPEVSK